MTATAHTRWLVLAFAVLLIASQGFATVSAPSVPVAQTGEVLGHAGFAYLGVFREFAAAVLWNRLEPIFHDYYRDVPLRKQKHLMPTVYVVQALDPKLEQPYYLGAYTLAAMGDFDSALQLAKRGVAENPKSGLLRANLVQILLMQDPEANMDEMQTQAAAGLSRGTEWTSPQDFYEGLAIFRAVYRKDGDVESVRKIQAAMDKVSSEVDVGDHDHDGDGRQDH